MAKSQTIARLGVQMALDSAEFKSGASNVIVETQKLRNSVAREMRAAEKEIQTLKYATEDYGKTVTKVAQLEREIEAGRFKNLKSTEGGQAIIARLREQAKAYDEVATKAKTAATGGLTEQQKLQLTYQTTDLVTQIASGQNALIALLQQGGQLKDSMGGFQGMFRALATVITPFRVAVGGAAAAVGLLAVAFYKGSQESQRLRDDMILTGNYAGMTQRKFFELSETIANKLNVTVGDSKTVFGQLVASGKFTQQSIGSVGEAILRVAELSGKSADEIAKDLIPAFDGSASSAKNLNDRMHFLTLEQYKQIEVLEKQGRTQEAAKLAADALNEKLANQERQLGTLERMWKAITTTASAAWDALLGIGRAESPEERIEKLTRQINKMAMTLQNANPDSVYSDKLRQNMIAKMEELGEEMRKQQEKEAKEQTSRDQTKLVNDYAKNGAKRRQLEGELQDQLAQNRYERLRQQANVEEQIMLEAEKKVALVVNETKRKNLEEAGVFAVENAKAMAAKIEAIELELAENIRQHRLKSQASTYAEILRMEDDEARNTQRRYEELLNNINQRIADETKSLRVDQERLELQERMIGMTQKERDIAESRLKLAQEIKNIESTFGLSDEEKKGIIGRLTDQQAIREQSIAMIDSIKRVEQAYESVFDNMMGAIERFVRTGKMSFRDLARSIIQDLIMIQIRAQASSIFSMMMGNMFGMRQNIGASGYSDMTTFNSLMSAGGLANGGPIGANEPHLVGERGPEIFMPRGAGTIIPNERLSSTLGGSTTVTNYNINAIDVKSFEDRLLGSANTIWAANLYAQKRLPLGAGRM